MADYGFCQTSDCRVATFEGSRCPSCDKAGVDLRKSGPLKWTRHERTVR